MKKIVILVLLAFATGGIAFAQAAPASTVTGTLGLYSGRIAVMSGTIVYYARGLERFVGFVEDFKEGAQVTIEGYASAPIVEGQTERFFSPIRLTLNGRVYELSSPQAAYSRFGNTMRPVRTGNPGWGRR